MKKIFIALWLLCCSVFVANGSTIEDWEELLERKEEVSTQYLAVSQNIVEVKNEIEKLNAEITDTSCFEIIDKYDLVSKISLMEYNQQNQIFINTIELLISKNNNTLYNLQVEKNEIVKLFGEISSDLKLYENIFKLEFNPVWPVPGYDKTFVTDVFGNGHHGYDIGANFGEDVVSAQSGTVISVDEHWSWGINVLIYHNKNFSTRYAHLSKAIVNVGDCIEDGEKIGEIGSTGNSTGNHLHYEVYFDGVRVDPETYFEFD